MSGAPKKRSVAIASVSSVPSSLPFRTRFHQIMTHTWVGHVWDGVQAAVSLTLFGLYIASTYMPVRALDGWEVTELVCVGFVLLDVLQGAVHTPKPLAKHILSANVLTDLALSVSVAAQLGASVQVELGFLSFFRLIRAMQLFQHFEVLRPLSLDPIKRQMTLLAFTLLTIVVGAAGLLVIVENNYFTYSLKHCHYIDAEGWGSCNPANVTAGDPAYISDRACDCLPTCRAHANRFGDTQLLCNNLSFFAAIYFTIVTVSTVGYGDIAVRTSLGRAVLLVFIVAALIVIPVQVNELTALISMQSAYRTKFRKRTEDALVLICGNVSSAADLMRFFEEFFHPDRRRNSVQQQDTEGAVADAAASLTELSMHAVVMSPEEPDEKLRSMLLDPLLFDRVTFVLGSVLVPDDLMRAGARDARAAFILTDKQSAFVMREDAATIMRALALKDFAPALETYVEILQPESKSALMEAEVDVMLCVEEMKMMLLARTCVAPGIFPLVHNIFSSFDTEAEDDDPVWRKEYCEGCALEAYVVPLPHAVIAAHHSSFHLLAHGILEQFAIVCLGVQRRASWRQERNVVLNPTLDVPLQAGDSVIVLADDLARADLIRLSGAQPGAEQEMRERVARLRKSPDSRDRVEFLINRNIKGRRDPSGRSMPHSFISVASSAGSASGRPGAAPVPDSVPVHRNTPAIGSRVAPHLDSHVDATANASANAGASTGAHPSSKQGVGRAVKRAARRAAKETGRGDGSRLMRSMSALRFSRASASTRWLGGLGTEDASGLSDTEVESARRRLSGARGELELTRLESRPGGAAAEAEEEGERKWDTTSPVGALPGMNSDGVMGSTLGRESVGKMEDWDGEGKAETPASGPAPVALPEPEQVDRVLSNWVDSPPHPSSVITRFTGDRHFLVMGSVDNLHLFVEPLRSMSLFGTHLYRPIVVLHSAPPADVPAWGKIKALERVYYLQGSPLAGSDLRAAGVERAMRVVVLADRNNAAQIEGQTLDASVILTYLALEKHVPPRLFSVVDMTGGVNMRVLNNKTCRRVRANQPVFPYRSADVLGFRGAGAGASAVPRAGRTRVPGASPLGRGNVTRLLMRSSNQVGEKEREVAKEREYFELQLFACGAAVMAHTFSDSLICQSYFTLQVMHICDQMLHAEQDSVVLDRAPRYDAAGSVPPGSVAPSYFASSSAVDRGPAVPLSATARRAVLGSPLARRRGSVRSLTHGAAMSTPRSASWRGRPAQADVNSPLFLRPASTAAAGAKSRAAAGMQDGGGGGGDGDSGRGAGARGVGRHAARIRGAARIPRRRARRSANYAEVDLDPGSSASRAGGLGAGSNAAADSSSGSSSDSDSLGGLLRRRRRANPTAGAVDGPTGAGATAAGDGDGGMSRPAALAARRVLPTGAQPAGAAVGAGAGASARVLRRGVSARRLSEGDVHRPVSPASTERLAGAGLAEDASPVDAAAERVARAPLAAAAARLLAETRGGDGGGVAGGTDDGGGSGDGGEDGDGRDVVASGLPGSGRPDSLSEEAALVRSATALSLSAKSGPAAVGRGPAPAPGSHAGVVGVGSRSERARPGPAGPDVSEAETGTSEDGGVDVFAHLLSAAASSQRRLPQTAAAGSHGSGTRSSTSVESGAPGAAGLESVVVRLSDAPAPPAAGGSRANGSGGLQARVDGVRRGGTMLGTSFDPALGRRGQRAVPPTAPTVSRALSSADVQGLGFAPETALSRTSQLRQKMAAALDRKGFTSRSRSIGGRAVSSRDADSGDDASDSEPVHVGAGGSRESSPEKSSPVAAATRRGAPPGAAWGTGSAVRGPGVHAQASSARLGSGSVSASASASASVSASASASAAESDPHVVAAGATVDTATAEEPASRRKSIRLLEAVRGAGNGAGRSGWAAMRATMRSQTATKSTSRAFAVGGSERRARNHGQVHQIPLPHWYRTAAAAGRRVTFGSLFFDMVLERQIIPIALYRAPTRANGAALPYVFTAPDPATALHCEDMVFVLASVDQLPELHAPAPAGDHEQPATPRADTDNVRAAVAAALSKVGDSGSERAGLVDVLASLTLGHDTPGAVERSGSVVRSRRAGFA